MKFYQRELNNFSYEELSVNQFKEKVSQLKEPFCVFLDEFILSNWSFYIRNLARAVGLVYVVSNTNTNITNFVSNGANNSRIDDSESGWSLVFRRLDNADSTVIDIKKYIDAIKERCENFANCSQAIKLVFEPSFTNLVRE